MTGAPPPAGPMSRRAEEEALIEGFVVPGRQARFRELLARPGRLGTTGLLANLRTLHPRWIVALPPGTKEPGAVATEIRRYGAITDCLVVSENRKVDGKRFLLEEALVAVMGHGAGSLLSCIPGTLAFWEGEGMGDRCILHRPPDAKPRDVREIPIHKPDMPELAPGFVNFRSQRIAINKPHRSTGQKGW